MLTICWLLVCYSTTTELEDLQNRPKTQERILMRQYTFHFLMKGVKEMKITYYCLLTLCDGKKKKEKYFILSWRKDTASRAIRVNLIPLE